MGHSRPRTISEHDKKLLSFGCGGYCLLCRCRRYGGQLTLISEYCCRTSLGTASCTCVLAIIQAESACRRASFESLPQWIADARALASPDLVLVIVGNKLDEEDDREVEYLEAARFAKENGKWRGGGKR